ncbi:MAG: ATP-binding cassette domain-containing protein, partial [Gimesia chilikensis]
TTLLNLLQQFYRPNSGKILIDGFDLSAVDLRSLRSQLGVVPQSPDIFSGTIRQNIAIAHPEASLNQVMQAAEAAGAHEFISRFPLGYDTVIGETGVRISGGQKQRIAIARALLSDPSILVFDEATSSLDAESERVVQQNMQEILKDRTAILVAHRLSTVRNADRILVLDEGQVVEQGTHQELLEQEGLYHHLVSEQACL